NREIAQPVLRDHNVSNPHATTKTEGQGLQVNGLVLPDSDGNSKLPCRRRAPSSIGEQSYNHRLKGSKVVLSKAKGSITERLSGNFEGGSNKYKENPSEISIANRRANDGMNLSKTKTRVLTSSLPRKPVSVETKPS